MATNSPSFLARIPIEIVPAATSANATNEAVLLPSEVLACNRLRLHYYQISPLVILVSISLFLHIGFLIKLILMTVYLSTFTAVAFSSFGNNRDGFSFLDGFSNPDDDQFVTWWPQAISTALFHYMFCFLLHILDRQVEFTSRSDFLWKAKLRVEQDEVETMGGINKILLENILPAHVAQHFLLSCTGNSDKLYHER